MHDRNGSEYEAIGTGKAGKSERDTEIDEMNGQREALRDSGGEREKEREYSLLSLSSLRCESYRTLPSMVS